MAIDILARYGIKEVADVVFYQLGETGLPEHPVLYLDTLKVSTIEQTAEEAEARGGKGNAALIAWDYGKEISVTLEDALFSAKSMAIMFGNGTVNEFSSYEEGTTAPAETTYDVNSQLIMKTLQFVYDGKAKSDWEGPDGKIRKMIHAKYYDAFGKELTLEGNELKMPTTTEGGTATAFANGQRYFVTFDVAAKGAVIEVSANSFPGTYYVTGDTYARSEASGKDEMFQFIIPKAKVTSENTITLEAEGDPSVFNMSLKVLRPADGKMMKLVKYDFLDEGTAAADSFAMVHNHVMDKAEG